MARDRDMPFSTKQHDSPRWQFCHCSSTLSSVPSDLVPSPAASSKVLQRRAEDKWLPHQYALAHGCSDQPQERILLGLKNVNSFRDCSICVAQSKPLRDDIRSAEDEWAIATTNSGDWGMELSDATDFNIFPLAGAHEKFRDVRKAVAATLL